MPLLVRHINPLRGIWKMEESSCTLLAMFESQGELLSCLETMGTEKRQQEWLSTRLLLRELMGKDMNICHLPDGAPFLPDNSFSISISHTKGFVAIVLDTCKRVGIDIEYRSDRIRKIKERFLSENELRKIDPANEIEHLLLHWCAKETLFKIIEEEEIDFREQLHIEPFTVAQSGTINAWESRTSAQNKYELSFEITPEYVWVWGCSHT